MEKEKLADILRVMLTARHFEQRCFELHLTGDIPGNLHLAIGQEAVAAGAGAALRPDDYLVTQHRADGHAIAKGVPLDRFMAEQFGRKTGVSGGVGGPNHPAWWDVGWLGAEGIVGSSIPMATGIALSSRLRGTDQVTLNVFGDGACNTARFHEGINLGALWYLPIIYLCENNKWASFVAAKDSTILKTLADRAAGYGIPGVAVDGNDPMAVYEVVSEAVARARRGEGPTLIECKSTRLGGHYSADREHRYRPQEDIDEGWKNEPIKKFRDKLIKEKVLTDKEADEIEQGVLAELVKAVKFASDSPFAEPNDVLEYIYA
jgi:pyruvate dehydrogenase E1 component alpha subunit